MFYVRNYRKEIARSITLAFLTIVLFAFTQRVFAEANLVAHWGFSEALSGVTYDQSANGLHGTLMNGAALSPGILGNSLSLDGLNDYVNVTTPGGDMPDVIGNLDQGSVSFWFKFDRLTASNEIFPVFYLGDGVGGPGNKSLIFEVGHFNAENSKLYFTVVANEEVRIPLCFDTGQQLATDTWYQFAASVSPTSNTGYLNGQELVGRHYNFGDATKSNFYSDITDQRAAWIGRGLLASYTTEQYFDGNIDELRIYDEPLSSKQIENQYLETMTGVESIFDGQPKTLVVNGYSTSYQWPGMLQEMIDEYYGITDPVDRVIKVVSAVQGGTPIAKWMDVETGEPMQPWVDTLRPAIESAVATGEPVIVLGQQSLQWSIDPNDRSAGIVDENDVANIELGADVFEAYAELLKQDGADKVFISSHIYKDMMEPEIGNERLALAELNERELANVYVGPDVWSVTELLYPEGFGGDQVHPNEIGAAAIAQAWFNYLAGYGKPCAERGEEGDYNCDGVVDLLDLDILGKNWGRSTLAEITSYSFGDGDGDGEVTLLDLNTLGANYRESTSIPEPSALIIYTVVVAFSIGRHIF